jgi:hypothetical protein
MTRMLLHRVRRRDIDEHGRQKPCAVLSSPEKPGRPRCDNTDVAVGNPSELRRGGTVRFRPVHWGSFGHARSDRCIGRISDIARGHHTWRLAHRPLTSAASLRGIASLHRIASRHRSQHRFAASIADTDGR